MYRQATLGDVDFITGDYLAGKKTCIKPVPSNASSAHTFLEVNMANNAQAYQKGEHPGYEETAWEGMKQTIDVIAAKRIKVIINGGALNPKGLAFKVEELVRTTLIVLLYGY
jgi:hypothetical protein